MADSTRQVLALEESGREQVALVGGKNASLGEMLRHLGQRGVRVPPGFATTTDAYWSFVRANDLDHPIRELLSDYHDGRLTLAEAGQALRAAFLDGQWPEATAVAIREAYRDLCRQLGRDAVAVAVRSSATAEDLPNASFAGQQESFLNVHGEEALLDACRRCFASLFTDRAISYREHHGFDHMKVALSVCVQQMVRADRGSAGVLFSIDTETGFDRVVVITAAWGLGETVVQGSVDPDEYHVFKPFIARPGLVPVIERRCGGKAQKMVYSSDGGQGTLLCETTDAERRALVLADVDVVRLADWACRIETHYGCAMDIEWAQDGDSGELFIVQARPETISAARAGNVQHSIRVASHGKCLLSGLSIGDWAAIGPVCRLDSPQDIARFEDGAVLVTGNTDPDWVPIMKRAAAIVTDHGGRTSHAAIVSRELGLPAVVGTGNATGELQQGQEVTVSCAEGDRGFVYEGRAALVEQSVDMDALPSTRTRVMLNLANPASAYRWWRLPFDGVGLARMEFVINDHVRVHPMALVEFDRVRDTAARAKIEALTARYADKSEYFVEQLATGLARIAAVAYPRPVIVRMSDFKTNEYANLIGGQDFEPREENPMLGFRGASRYYSPRYREGFGLECQAIRRLRERKGFDNVIVMIPFCRTLEEADRVLEVMAANGLRRGERGLEIYVMCELPSNVILASAFAERFDGFSIGSNDLTQLVLGVDRDSEELASLFSEQNEAVLWMIRRVIDEAGRAGRKIGLCGQAPSDQPGFTEFLVRCGIDSLSVTPDSFIRVKQHVAQVEAALGDTEQAREGFSWDKARWDKARKRLSGLPDGGINIAFEALDRHIDSGHGEQVAIRWLGQDGTRRDISYAELTREASRFANVLKDQGLAPGDRVFALLGRVPELYAVALGTLRAGMTFTPLFAAFGPEPVRSRMEIGDASVLVTTEPLYRKKIAAWRHELPGLKQIFVLGDEAPEHCLALGPAMASAATESPVHATLDETTALIHFTSGTTGRPKGAVHVHGAVVAHAETGRIALDLQPGDIYWCTADPGWVTGTTYGIISPLVNRCTVVVDEAEFETERWYSILQDEKVQVWYTAPTAIRMLMRAGEATAKGYDFSALRLLASVGEPLNAECVVWGQKVFGIPFHDNWWQTETGGIMIANIPAMDIKPGSMGKPLPGIRAGIVEREGAVVTELPAGAIGELALRAGWPSMMRAYLNETERYEKCFADGWYLTGDLAMCDSDGYYWFVGRADDLIKSSGHLIGPFEVESALIAHEAVAEAAVIGIPDETAGDVVKAYVTLNIGFEPDEATERSIRAWARKRLGPAVAPREIVFRQSLPKTRSGKIMRRLLRARELGLPEGDISTLESDET